MPFLKPCPRCTQSLPVSAGFCRRCGLSVPGGAPAVESPVVGGGTFWKFAAFVAVGVVAMIVLGTIGVDRELSAGLGSGPTALQVMPALTNPNFVTVPSVASPRVTYPFGAPAGSYAVQQLTPPNVRVPKMPPVVYPPTRVFTPGYPRAGVPGQVYGEQQPRRW